MSFTPLPPLPPNVRLSALTDWRHRPIPNEARARRDNPAVPVVWVGDDQQLAGIIAPDQEVAWDLGAGSRAEATGQLGSVELEFARPGKGRGYFVLVFVRPGEPGPISVAKAEPFDDEHFVWFIALAQTLAEALGVPARLLDVGADA